MNKNFVRLAATTTLATLGLFSTGKTALAGEDLVFTLANASTYTVTEFYASPSAIDNWENDILATQDVYPSESILIHINDNRDVCEYDLLTIFSDGDVIEEYDVDLCDLDGGTYEVSEG